MIKQINQDGSTVFLSLLQYLDANPEKAFC
jgi:hypothetical protein